ncbi:MAG: CBS domain-containing protein [Rhodocyclales bacterium]|nr:CBS domain-containing protein [Rhodocyclales bacterium]
MSSIRNLLQNKKPLVTARVSQTVNEAVAQMTGADVGAVIVLDDLGHISGIFTERDCLQKVTRPCLDPCVTPLREVMTTSVRFARPEQTIEERLRLMTERYFRHLPVLDAHGNILGIISIGDLVKARLSEQEFAIDQMEHYIADSLPVGR